MGQARPLVVLNAKTRKACAPRYWEVITNSGVPDHHITRKAMNCAEGYLIGCRMALVARQQAITQQWRASEFIVRTSAWIVPFLEVTSCPSTTTGLGARMSLRRQRHRADQQLDADWDKDLAKGRAIVLPWRRRLSPKQLSSIPAAREVAQLRWSGANTRAEQSCAFVRKPMHSFHQKVSQRQRRERRMYSGKLEVRQSIQAALWIGEDEASATSGSLKAL